MNIGRWGGLSFNMIGTWLDKLITDTGISAPYDCAGLYGLICSRGTCRPEPEWRHKARLTWNAPDGIGLVGCMALLRQRRHRPVERQAACNGAFSPFNAGSRRRTTSTWR